MFVPSVSKFVCEDSKKREQKLHRYVFSDRLQGEISSTQGGEYKDGRRLGCYALGLMMEAVSISGSRSVPTRRRGETSQATAISREIFSRNRFRK
jgi:hypothetical protein